MQAPVPKKISPRDSLEFYYSILDNSTDLISVLNEQGYYQFVGGSVKRLLGFEPDELVGVSAFTLIHPEDVPLALSSMEEVLTVPQVQLPPFRFQSKSGQWHWIDCTATNMLQNEHVRGIVTNSRDITKAIDLAYRNDYHQAYYESLFFEHPDAVFTLNLKGEFQQVNQHMQTLAGYPDADVLGIPYTALVHPDSREQADKAFQRISSGEAHTVELCIVTKNQSIRNISLSVMPVYFRGELMGAQGIARDITEAVKSQKLVKEQAQQLNNIVESISEPFYALDSHWRFTFVSAAFASFVNMDRSAITGTVIWELFPELVHTKFYAASQEVARDKTTLHFEENFSQPRQCTLSVTLYPASDGIAVHLVDITTQKQIQQQIEKLSFVASKTINGVTIMDTEGRIEWVNDGFCRLTGYDRNEVVGITPSDLLQGPETDPETSKRIRGRYHTLKPFSEEILNYKKNGEKIWFYIDVTPIFDQQGNLQNYIAIQTDITEKKEAETKLVKLADDLYKQNLDLQQFTYIISHNLRAPVANALGLAQLVKKLPKEAASYDAAIEKLYDSIDKLDSVVKDINKVLSIRDTGRNSPREMVNLQEVCQEVLHDFKEKLEASEAAVEMAIPPDYALLSIRSYLYSILHNLFSNSIKYKSEKRRLELCVEVKRDKRGYVLTVRDNGSGMDMHLVEHQLFQLYKRFHPNISGKGIGLFLVKTQVQALSGKIVVESAPDAGTTFKIFLGAKHV